MRYVFYTTPNADLRWILGGAGDPVRKVWVYDDEDAPATIRSVLDLTAAPAEILVEDAFSFSGEVLPEGRPAVRRFSAPVHPVRLPRIAFFADSDTLAATLAPVIRALRGLLPAAVFVSAVKKEGAARVFAARQIDYEVLTAAAFVRAQPDVLVLANDWSTEGKMLLAMCRRMGASSVCLQESVVHFGDPRRRRMERADAVFLQGAFTTKFLLREHTFITGNPRYEALAFRPPPRPRAFVNCNFTYGVYEDRREGWLRAVVETLERHGIDYVISQHPRDFGDLSGFRNVARSNAGVVHAQLAACSFVVSRFSSIIHEAVCLGRPVLYFNPHGEALNYDFGFDAQVVRLARDGRDLDAGVRAVAARPFDAAAFGRYVQLHCKSLRRAPSALIAGLLQHARFDAADARPSNLPASMLKYFFRRTLSRS